MKTISRTEAGKRDATDKKMLRTEKHHKHPIVEFDKKLYWQPNPQFDKLVYEIGLEKIWQLFEAMGYNKNSEIIRHFYRMHGYSLFGYWEIFYWEANNEIAHKYKPNPMALK